MRRHRVRERKFEDTKAHYEKKGTVNYNNNNQVSKQGNGEDFLMNGGSAQRGIGTEIKSK